MIAFMAPRVVFVNVFLLNIAAQGVSFNGTSKVCPRAGSGSLWLKGRLLTDFQHQATKTPRHQEQIRRTAKNGLVPRMH
jgi:hypothetical protein